jgi:hypothetical protein
MRIAPSELAELQRVADERGEGVADAVRSLPMLWAEREALVRAALEPVVGTLTRGEVTGILDVMNGVYLSHEAGGGLLGGHVALEVHDGIRFGLGAQHEIRDGLAERIAAMPRAARVALELWCADLWRSHEDDELWEREIAWLAGEVAS